MSGVLVKGLADLLNRHLTVLFQYSKGCIDFLGINLGFMEIMGLVNKFRQLQLNICFLVRLCSSRCRRNARLSKKAEKH